jgi:hypothetical protein
MVRRVRVDASRGKIEEPGVTAANPMTYSRSNPSPRFRELLEQYRQMHRGGDPRHGRSAAETFDGRSLPRQAPRIRSLVLKTAATTILDYGSGKGTQYLPAKVTENGVPKWNSIQEYWGVDSIGCYDPGYEPFSKLPQGTFHGVVCTDVLEHCPEEDLEWIVTELFAYSSRFVFANVACYPARKSLPSGENAHCTILPVERWHELFRSVAARFPAVLWEVWADVIRGAAHVEIRNANFPPAAQAAQAPASRTPVWRLV